MTSTLNMKTMYHTAPIKQGNALTMEQNILDNTSSDNKEQANFLYSLNPEEYNRFIDIDLLQEEIDRVFLSICKNCICTIDDLPAVDFDTQTSLKNAMFQIIVSTPDEHIDLVLKTIKHHVVLKNLSPTGNFIQDTEHFADYFQKTLTAMQDDFMRYKYLYLDDCKFNPDMGAYLKKYNYMSLTVRFRNQLEELEKEGFINNVEQMLNVDNISEVEHLSDEAYAALSRKPFQEHISTLRANGRKLNTTIDDVLNTPQKPI